MQNRNAPSKDCTVPGCSGTMTLRRSQDAQGAASSSSSGGRWVCDTDSSHTEAAGREDE
jgi:hypothetical protein